MWKKFFAAGAVIAGIFTAFCGGKASALVESSANITGGNWNICVTMTGGYVGSSFAATISGSGFETQIVYDDFDYSACKSVTLPDGDYSVSMNVPMGIYSMINAVSGNNLNFLIGGRTQKYLSNYGSSNQRIAANTASIEFNANGGTGAMTPMTDLELNTNYNLPTNTFTRDGYRFNGWSSAADGTGNGYADGGVVNFWQSTNLVLYAQWVQDGGSQHQNEAELQLLKTGSEFNMLIRTMMSDEEGVNCTTPTECDASASAIKHLYFVETLPEELGIDRETATRVKLSRDGYAEVYAYRVGDDTVYVETGEKTVFADYDASYMFYGFQITELVLPNNFDTSKIVNMSYMFANTAIENLVLSDNFSIAMVTTMEGTFSNMAQLQSITLPDSFTITEGMSYPNIFDNTPGTATLHASDQSLVEAWAARVIASGE